MLKNIFTNKKIVIGLVISVALAFIIFVAFYIPSMPFRPPEVVSVTPTNGATDVFNRAIISVNFSKQVPIEEQGNFYLRLLPGVSGTTSWETPSRLVFVPSQILQSSTTYQMAVSYSGKLLSETQFTTRFMRTYTEEEQEQFREWAFVTSQAMYEIFDDYPFLENLPIETDSYNIMFDTEQDQFRYYLKMDENVPEELVNEAVENATIDLRQIGVEVEDYGYYILFASE